MFFLIESGHMSYRCARIIKKNVLKLVVSITEIYLNAQKAELPHSQSKHLRDCHLHLSLFWETTTNKFLILIFGNMNVDAKVHLQVTQHNRCSVFRVKA